MKIGKYCREKNNITSASVWADRTVCNAVCSGIFLVVTNLDSNYEVLNHKVLIVKLDKLDSALYSDDSRLTGFWSA